MKIGSWQKSMETSRNLASILFGVKPQKEKHKPLHKSNSHFLQQQTQTIPHKKRAESEDTALKGNSICIVY